MIYILAFIIWILPYLIVILISRKSKFITQALAVFAVSFTIEGITLISFHASMYIIGRILFMIGVALGIYGLFETDIKAAKASVILFISTFLVLLIIGFGFDIDILKTFTAAPDGRSMSFAFSSDLR